MGFYANGAAGLAVAVPLQGRSVMAGAQQANFPQVGQFQALGSFAAGRVIGVSRHKKQVAAQVAEILRESYGWLPDFVRWPARKRQAKLVGLSYVLTHVLE